MMAGMSSRQMSEWQALWQLEPFGEFREDWRWACLMALIANMMRDSKKQEPLNPSDFMSLLDPTGETEAPPSATERAATEFESMWEQMMYG
jgi:hypothetical protein